MGILTDVAKYALNRLNIDPNDLLNDSNSKLSRCSHSNSDENGEHHIVKTDQGRVETERIEENLLKSDHRYFINKNPEQIICLRGIRIGSACKFMRCRDYRKPTSCPLYSRLTTVSISIPTSHIHSCALE